MTQKETNPYKNSDDNKRYYTYDRYLKKRFGMKCAKLSLDGGFTCPNKDGSRGVGGCIYCSSSGSGEFERSGSIAQQLAEQKKVYERKWSGKKLGYIAYFQSNTNTYAPIDRLSSLYTQALDCDGVIGLDVATRADALNDDVCRLLGELSKSTFVTVELGLQTCHDEVARRINRCHTTREFLLGYESLRKYGNIRICTHIINGFMWENEEMMIENAKFVSDIGSDGIKIHSLLVLKDSTLGKMYLASPFELQSREDYINTVIAQLEVINGDMVVERLVADTDESLLIAPEWVKRKTDVLNGIDKLMYSKNTYQGRLFKN